MKKAISLSILTGLLLSLVACTGKGPQAATENALPVESQLVAGTLKLEGTELAVTSEQAADLLVIWQVYVELGESDTAAQAEIDALIEQAQETMTKEQVDAILAMQITQRDVFALIMEQGSDLSSTGQASGGASSGGGGGFASPEDGGMGGGMPGGGAPPDGGMMPGGEMGAGQPSGAVQGEESPANAGPMDSAGVPSALVEALIQLLEQRVAS